MCWAHSIILWSLSQTAAQTTAYTTRRPYTYTTPNNDIIKAERWRWCTSPADNTITFTSPRPTIYGITEELRAFCSCQIISCQLEQLLDSLRRLTTHLEFGPLLHIHNDLWEQHLVGFLSM